MNFEIKATPKFERELKRLVKKYVSLKTEFFELVNSLKLNPTQGTPLGKDCYKIRLAIASKGKGKSGGARLISYIQVHQTTVYLLTIYDKSETEKIPDNEIESLLNGIE